MPDCKNFYWEIQYDSDISSHREHFCIQEKTSLWLNARQSRVRLVGRLQGKVYKKSHYKNFIKIKKKFPRFFQFLLLLGIRDLGINWNCKERQINEPCSFEGTYILMSLLGLADSGRVKNAND